MTRDPRAQDRHRAASSTAARSPPHDIDHATEGRGSTDLSKGTLILLSHAIALAEARTYLAALANQSTDLDTSLAYERVLLHLDANHRVDVPRIEAGHLVDDLTTLHTVAEAAINDLAEHTVIDALQVELLLAMLADARVSRDA